MADTLYTHCQHQYLDQWNMSLSTGVLPKAILIMATMHIHLES